MFFLSKSNSYIFSLINICSNSFLLKLDKNSIDSSSKSSLKNVSIKSFLKILKKISL